MLYMVAPVATSSGRSAIPQLDDACVNRLRVRTICHRFIQLESPQRPLALSA